MALWNWSRRYIDLWSIQGTIIFITVSAFATLRLYLPKIMMDYQREKMERVPSVS